MQPDQHPGSGRQCEPGQSDPASDNRVLEILHRYSAGEISSREAAREMGPNASEHDVFAGILEARLKLPEPPPEQVEREVASLKALYGLHGPRRRG